METVKAIKCRRSIRRYTGKLSEESLQAVLMAGKAAPIGMARYREMHMTVIRDKAILDELNRNAAEYCQKAEPLYNAPCLILISTVMEDPFRYNVYYSDAAVMAENMHLMATDMGLGSCLIWGTILALGTNKELIKKLNLPEGHVPCCGIIIGETEEKFPEREIPGNKISVSYMG